MNSAQAKGNVYGTREVCDTKPALDLMYWCTDARHAHATSQDMTARCSMATHLEAGKEYDLSTLVINANGNASKCKTPISSAHLAATFNRLD